MKRKRNNYRDDMISDLREASSSFCNDDKEKFSALVDKLDNSISEAKKKLSNLFLILLVIIVGLLFFTLLLLDRNETVESRLNYLEQRESLLVQFMAPDSTDNISYYSENDRPITYHHLFHENDSLRKISDSLKIYMDLVTKNYPISFHHDSNIFFVSSPEIDSALMLLNLYRDKIQYNPYEKTWIVTRESSKKESRYK